MADILLTHSNHIYNDPKQVRKMQPYAPLQTLVAAACLRRAGYSVALFDSTFEDPDIGFARSLATHRPRMVAACEDNFNFLTKMCLLRNRELACRMARMAQDAGVPAVANGPDCNDHATEYLDAGFRFVIAGEVEESIVDAARHLLDGAPLASMSGRVAPRAPIADLDALPPPAWDLVDPAPYREAWTAAHGYFSWNMASSRGCPYRCNWCAKPIWGDHYRSRSACLVAKEMLEVKTRFAPDHLWFADDIFALSAHWTCEFANAVIDQGARTPFKMQSRCDLMTRATVDDLARAGCAEVWMGVESASQRVLDAMDKGTRVEQIWQARENLRRRGVRACYFLQFGYPGETWTDIERTIAMVRETRPDDIGVSVSYPLPGTEFHRRVSSELGPKENWSDSGDLDMMFQGAYTTEFYRALADALHSEVRDGESAAAGAWANVLALKETCARKVPLWISC